MSRSSAGPLPQRPSGAVSRAQKPAPPGAMRSGAWNEGSPSERASTLVADEAEDDQRGRSPSTKANYDNTHEDEDGSESIGPLPDRADSHDRAGNGSTSSRDASLARRLSAGLNNVLRGRSGSRERESRTLSRQDTDASTILYDAERGRDRGREAPVSTGRGGVGNVIRSPSRGRPAEEQGETAAQREYAERQTVISSGRGGAGNVRSPSRGPRAAELDEQEREIQAAALRKDEALHITGRGGAGNIKRDHSNDARGREGAGSSSGGGGGGGGVGSALRSMSRSRSREPRSSSAHREANNTHNPHGSSPLAAVDEKGSVSGASNASAANGNANGNGSHQGLFGKIAAHLPGHSHGASNGSGSGN